MVETKIVAEFKFIGKIKLRYGYTSWDAVRILLVFDMLTWLTPYIIQVKHPN